MSKSSRSSDAVMATGSSTHEVRLLSESDAFAHDLVRRLAGVVDSPFPHRHFVLPPRPGDGSADQMLVVSVDGLVVARAILEAAYPPYSELVNMGVRPDYQRRGLGSVLVREAMRRARAMGSEDMALQTDLDNVRAQRFYESLDFVPAARGEMLRMLAPLDVPALNLFRLAHPACEFASGPDEARGTGWWRLEWRAGEEYLALLMCGGSCQGDSNGLMPTVRAFELREGALHLFARVDAPDTIDMGDPAAPPEPGQGRAAVRVSVRNLGSGDLTLGIRGVLLPEFALAEEASEPLPELHAAPGEEVERAFTLRVKPAFSRDVLRDTSYPSVPLTAEVCWGEGTVLLSAAARVG